MRGAKYIQSKLGDTLYGEERFGEWVAYFIFWNRLSSCRIKKIQKTCFTVIQF